MDRSGSTSLVLVSHSHCLICIKKVQLVLLCCHIRVGNHLCFLSVVRLVQDCTRAQPLTHCHYDFFKFSHPAVWTAVGGTNSISDNESFPHAFFKFSHPAVWTAVGGTSLASNHGYSNSFCEPKMVHPGAKCHSQKLLKQIC